MSDVSKVIDNLLSEADQHDARSIKIREAVEAIRSVSLASAVDAPKRGRPARVFRSSLFPTSGVMVKDIPVKASKKTGKRRKYTKRSAFWKKKK